jgi:predicted nucleic acid-binding protein
VSVFVDTSVWFAAIDAREANNARAKAILSAGKTLVTSDHVLIETWTLLRNSIHQRAADKFWDALRSGIAVVEPVGPSDLDAAH